MLQEISIYGFKGYVSKLEIKELKTINYVVGKNGSGKSSAFQLLDFIPKNPVLNFDNATRYFGDPTFVFNEKFELSIHYSVRNTPNIIHETRYILDDSDWKNHVLKFNLQGTVFLQEVLYTSTHIPVSEISSGEQILREILIRPHIRDESMSSQEVSKVVDLLKSITADGGNLLTLARSTGNAASLQFIDKEGNHKNLKADATGIRTIIGLFMQLQQYISSGEDLVIILEEPETGLHPGLQKQLPMLFENVVKQAKDKQRNIQFVVITHSPFIISAARSHKEQSRIYLFENFESRDLSGIGSKPEGYSINKALLVASKMLGAGVEDIVKEASTGELVNVIYCEGMNLSGKKTCDSALYERIFNGKGGPGRSIFISALSADNVQEAYFSGKELAPYVFGAQTKTLALIDRSDSSRDGRGLKLANGEMIGTSPTHIIFTDEERSLFLDRDTGFRMLRRREIENYIFDPTVLMALGEKALSEIISTQDYKYGNIKDYINSDKSFEKYRTLEGKQILALQLAQLQQVKDSVYWELHEDIFGVE